MSESTPPVQRPATRAARLSAIEQVLLKHIVTSQSQLSDLLSQEGIEVTQATLSRDIRELHLVKQRRSGKRACYTAPVIQEGTSGIFQDAVLRTDHAGHMAVIHCRSGMAQAVAVALDSVKREGVVGTIAGDDTVFVLLRTETLAREFALFFGSSAGKGGF